MGLSSSQRFLVEADRVGSANDYFRWRDVGQTLGFTDGESHAAVQSLNERKLLILLFDGDARLLPTGRDLARKLTHRANEESAAGGGRRPPSDPAPAPH